MTKKLFAFLTVIALFVQLLGPIAGPFSSVKTVQACEPRCGDGIVNQQNEECDDGNTDNNDGCMNNCKIGCPSGELKTEVIGSQDEVSWTANSGDIIRHIVIKTGTPCFSSGWLDTNDNYSGSAEDPNECWVPDDNCYEVSGMGTNTVTVRRTADGNSCKGISGVIFCSSEKKPQCGDDVLDEGEQCDDGNLNDFDGCSSQCKIEKCGDNILQPGEECDDGNLNDFDGCSATCKVEKCGDNIVQPGEQCDDGNIIDGDGCSAKCTIEQCGNDILDPGEECDDGNLEDGDGCSSKCEIEECGNGRLDYGEDCDDGNKSNNDDCLNNCTLPECGDSYLWEGHEQCDDGNKIDNDGCSPTCETEEPTKITACKWEDQNGYDDKEYDKDEPMSGVTVSLQKCVDNYGILDSQFNSHTCTKWEELDSGTTGDDGCYTFTTAEFEEGEYRVELVENLPLYELFSENPVDLYIKSHGQNLTVDFYNYPTCGNGIFELEFGEECDGEDGVPAHYICNEDCELEYIPYCGDGTLDTGETCDDGNNTDNDSCSATCQIEVCGDGILQTALGEKCDDGNTKGGDGCSAVCRIEKVLAAKTTKKVLGAATGSPIAMPLVISFALALAIYLTDFLRKKNLIRREEKLCERNIRDRFKDRF